MRLNESQVIEGITHWCPFVRHHAVKYFAESACNTPQAMLAVIKGIGEHGWDEFLPFSHLVPDLLQTEESVRWCIDELAKAAAEGYQPNPRRIGLRDRLPEILAGADVPLLKQFQVEIFELERVPPRHREKIVLRMRLHERDADACWNELEAFCEREKDTQYGSELDVQMADALVEAVARHGEDVFDRVERVLEDAEHIEDWRGNPLSWLEGFAVRIAGRMGWEAAVPRIIHKLHHDAEWLSEQCLKALGSIGTDTVVEQIGQEFASGDWPFRLYASGALERIHRDLCLRTVIDLFQAEEDEDIRIWLATAAMADFAEEAVQLVLDHPELRDHSEWGGLRDDVAAVCPLIGFDFADLDQWRWESESERRRIDGLLNEPRHWTDLVEQAEDREPVPVGFPDPHRTAKRLLADDYDESGSIGLLGGAIRHQAARVGRNDPCPCGSGKKYKQCCLRKPGM